MGPDGGDLNLVTITREGEKKISTISLLFRIQSVSAGFDVVALELFLLPIYIFFMDAFD